MRFVRFVQFVQVAPPARNPIHSPLQGRKPPQNALSPTFAKNSRCVPVLGTTTPVRLSSGGGLLYFLSNFCRNAKKKAIRGHPEQPTTTRSTTTIERTKIVIISQYRNTCGQNALYPCPSASRRPLRSRTSPAPPSARTRPRSLRGRSRAYSSPPTTPIR